MNIIISINNQYKKYLNAATKLGQREQRKCQWRSQEVVGMFKCS